MKNLLANLPADLSGKRIMIAGGTKDYGREITLKLASMGAKLMVLSEEEEALNKTMKLLRAMNCESRCYGMIAEPSDPDDIRIILDVIERHFRGLDILINNNMFTFPRQLHTGELSPDDLLYTRLQGQLYCTRELIRQMEKTENACILNVNTIGSEMRRKYRLLCDKARVAFREFNSTLCREAADKNVTVILSSL